MDKKLLAIGLVAVIVVIGVAAYFIVSDSDEDEYVPENTEGRLMIYGNANNDDYLDKADLKLIEKILDGDVDWDKVNNRFADANNDGRVTQADADMVKKLIDREPMNVWYVDGDDVTQKIKYPLKNIVVIGKGQMVRAQALDILDNVVGISGSRIPLDPILHKTISQKPWVSNSPTGLDIAMYSEVAQSVPGGVDAVFCAEGGLQKEEAACKENGITLLRMNSNDIPYEVKTYLTLGFLIKSEERSHELVKFLDAFQKDLDERLSKVTTKPVVTVSIASITSTGGGKIVPLDGPFTDRIYDAGGTITVTKEDLGGMIGKPIEPGDVWHLSDKFQGDFFLDMTTGAGYNTLAADYAKFWNNFENPEYSITKMDAYPDGFGVVSRDLPGVVVIAYIAEFIHPELFEKGYADKVHQAWGDMFFQDLQGFDASKVISLATYDDVKAYL